MAHEVPQGRLARLATLALAGLATAAVELAIAEPERSQLAALAGASVFLMPVLAVAWYRARKVVPETHVERSAMSGQAQGERAASVRSGLCSSSWSSSRRFCPTSFASPGSGGD